MPARYVCRIRATDFEALVFLLVIHGAAQEPLEAVAVVVAPEGVKADASLENGVSVEAPVYEAVKDGDQEPGLDTTLPGDEEFQQAMALLNTIKPPRRRLARYSKPAGVIGAIGYYARELFSLLFMNGPKFDSKHIRKTAKPLAQALDLLEQAADVWNPDALYVLAEMNFYGLHTHARNYTVAWENYIDLADLEGNSTAQHMVGFMFATGVGGAVEPDQARALLYHTFAADAGDVRAQMTTAYRHHVGIGTPRDCEKAVHYYKLVADEAMAYARSGPPGGRSMVREAYRLADEEGGVYGEGASVLSSGDHAKRSSATQDTNAAFDDVLEYLDLMSRKGDLKAIFSLGRLHYEGSRALQRNYRIAKDKFFDVARRYWDKNGRTRPDTEPGVDKLASKAAGYLGRMFLRGEDSEQNFQVARLWFERGIKNGDAHCQYSMGLMHLHGLGMPKHPVRAAEYFSAAADQDHAAAQVRLGALFMDQGDLAIATKYFEFATRHGHIEAYYFLAEVANLGAQGQRNCNQAALYYKIVAEKAEDIHSNFGEANDAYEEGDVETALLYYMMAAEQGYEAGQANVAYLLDKALFQKSQVKRWLAALWPALAAIFGPPLDQNVPVFGDASLALVYWTRSARGSNIDSLLKMGDYYLAGIGALAGTAETAEPVNATDSAAKAAACYVAASETYESAQALFNVGWMHENGIGLAQDFHLAKRYYDLAAEPPMKEARVPVALALAKLRVRSWWNKVTGGTINDIKDVPKEKPPRRTFWEWVGEFLAADLEMYEEEQARLDEAGRDEYLEEWDHEHVFDGQNHGGRHRGGGDGLVEDDEWDDALADFVETLVIIGFAATLAGLVWYRQVAGQRQQQRQGAEQRELQQQEQQQWEAQQRFRDQAANPAPTRDDGQAQDQDAAEPERNAAAQASWPPAYGAESGSASGSTDGRPEAHDHNDHDQPGAPGYGNPGAGAMGGPAFGGFGSGPGGIGH